MCVCNGRRSVCVCNRGGGGAPGEDECVCVTGEEERVCACVWWGWRCTNRGGPCEAELRGGKARVVEM